MRQNHIIMIKKYLVRVLGVGVYTALLFELMSFFFLFLGFGKVFVPSYSWSAVRYHREVRETPQEFGHWYQPDISATVGMNRYLSCPFYSIDTNSYGARDIERTQQSDDVRVFVLGDSYLEGVGVDVEARMTNQLEDLSGREHLNFAINNTGSMHHWRVYETFGGDFEHDAILIGIYPKNDLFVDADINKKLSQYAAYSGDFLVGDYPNYEVKHHKGYTGATWSTYVRAFLREYTNSYHVLQTTFINIRASLTDTVRINQTTSAYHHFTDEEFLRFVTPLGYIAEDASDKDIYLFSIPWAADIQAYDGVTPPFTQQMNEFAAQYDNVSYFDLLGVLHDQMGEEYSELYQPCFDPHFSEYGNQFIAKILFENLELYK